MGQFLAACNEQVSYVIDAATTEALAIRRGVALANEMGFDRIIIQSDCLEAIETMHGGGFSSSAAERILIFKLLLSVE
jgi:hypothetical protein